MFTKRDRSRLGGKDTRAVDVVGLAVELHQFATPVLAALCGDVLQHVEHRPVDALPPVLGDEDQVVMQRSGKACAS